MMIKDTRVRCHVKVHVRVRPPLPRELDKDNKFHSCIGVGSTTEKGQTIYVSCDDSPILISKEGGGGKNLARYTFDTVFPGSSSQEDVYQTTTEPIVSSALAGYNASVLAYGQTGAGKTYTMVGEAGEKAGITGRALKQIFKTKGVKVTMSVLQIYKETLVDLLGCSRPPCDVLQVRQVNGEVRIDGLTQHEVWSRKEGMELLESALSRRAVGGTLLNEVSSRSHMIITINVTTKKTIGKLNLVDLAGSERLKDSGAEGARRQETCAINSSLFALVAVVESLSSRSKFVPYRNSKLTTVLSDSLGGNCLTTVLVNVSPSQKFGAETLSSLKFAHSCKRIEKIVVRNQTQAQRPATAPVPVMILPWAGDDIPEITSELIQTKLGPVCCHYAGDAEGPPIILLHGSPSSFGEFRHFLPALSYIGYRVIGVDQPGYGASPGERFPSRSDKAAKKGGPIDILKEVLRYHKLKESSLLGYDWGGGIALTFGILYPKKVTKIISFLPSFSETESIKLSNLRVPTMIEWVRQDQNHSWRRFQPLADKIRKAIVEVINVPSSDRDYARDCYEKFSGQVVKPMIKFLSGQDVVQATKKVYNAVERNTVATDGKEVVEVSNVNFQEDLSEENIEEMLSIPRPGVNAILLFEKLGKRHGYKEVYKADENQTHELHRKVATVFRSLPALSPDFLRKDPEAVVRLGLWKGLGQGFYEMLGTPRYFKGRQVLIKTSKSDPEQIVDPKESDEKSMTQLGRIVEVLDDSVRVELEKDGGDGPIVDTTKKQIIQLNHPHKFDVDLASRLILEDGIRCDYNNRTVRAKLVEICLSLAPVVERLDFFSSDCEDVQKEAVRTIRSCLDIVTFQVGLDRSRAARTDCVGKLATNGQAHCHGVSSTMAAFLLPLSPLLGIDLKYRGVYTFSGPKGVRVSDVERHQCLEISLRPSGSSWITDLWLTETYDNNAWLTMDVNTAYYRFMYPNGKLILNTKPENFNKTDFQETGLE